MFKAIVHFDGDSFFASVEQVLNFRLKGKPIVTGAERGAITSASIEAKKMGVGRGVSLRDAKKLCPKLIVVPSNYMAYSIFARRMYNIVREFTSDVEEYSIDECFADITGLDKKYKKSYEEIALMIKQKLEKSLGVTYGVGLGPNKVLSKAASKHRKPAGFTSIFKEDLEEFLKNIRVEKLWGIGMKTAIYLNKRGVVTALDFAQKTEGWLEAHELAKPYKEMWMELQGHFVKTLSVQHEMAKSIIQSRTFRPASSDPKVLMMQLSNNIQGACNHARRVSLRAGRVRFYLKTQEFSYRGFEIEMSVPTSTPIEIVKLVRENFDKVYQSGFVYRATGICLYSLIPEGKVAVDLFEESLKAEKNVEIFEAVDRMSKKYGKDTIMLGSGMREDKRRGSSKVLELPVVG